MLRRTKELGATLEYRSWIHVLSGDLGFSAGHQGYLTLVTFMGSWRLDVERSDDVFFVRSGSCIFEMALPGFAPQMARTGRPITSP